jgi:hypothetical protein
MEPIFTAPISTWTLALFRASVQFLQYAELRACPRCGLKVVAHATDGMCELDFQNPSDPLNLLRFRLVAEATPDGKLSILCACSQLGSTASATPTSSPAGISCSRKSSERGVGFDIVRRQKLSQLFQACFQRVPLDDELDNLERDCDRWLEQHREQ